ncbi:hypothetical protein [Photobacterium damselae]|uniref:hypothetical protein n=1 Tax=Photobacterium damselae TaxID=38293 RepID=UPI00406988BB
MTLCMRTYRHWDEPISAESPDLTLRLPPRDSADVIVLDELTAGKSQPKVDALGVL